MSTLADILHEVLGFTTVAIEEVVEDVIGRVDIADSVNFLENLQEALPLDEDTAIHLVVLIQERADVRTAKKRRIAETLEESQAADSIADVDGSGRPLTFVQAAVLAATERNAKYQGDVVYLERLREESRREYLKEREKVQLDLAKRVVEDRAEWAVDNPAVQERLRKLNDIEKAKIELAEAVQEQRALSSRAAMTTYNMPTSITSTRDQLDVLRHRVGNDRDPAASARAPQIDEWELQKLKDGVPQAKENSATTTKLIDEEGNEIEFVKAELDKVGSASEARDEWWHMSLAEREVRKQEEILAKRDKIRLSRRSLPVYKFRKQVLKAIKENSVVILVGETGSGKTTQLPQFLNEVGYGDLGVIACSQPRRVAAMSVAVRVAEEMGVKLGQEVGYIIRFESEVTGNDNIKGTLPTNVTKQKTDDSVAFDRRTRICYMTDGVLLNQFMIDPLLSAFSCVMIDEAHERSVNTDILFALVKDLARYREDDLRVIISSATMEAEKLSSYFDDAPIFTIPGRKHHVDILYTKQPEANFIHAAALTTMQIHLNEPLYEERVVAGIKVKEHNGDILVFLPGQQEIEECMNMIFDMLREHQEASHRRLPELKVLPIYSSLPSDQQALIFQPTPVGTRKCILATNIAETSITIENIVYVVDPGLVKQNGFNPRTGVQTLVTVMCSRASCNQRAGRAGRVRPGKCYRLFTQISWQKELEENNTPEILRCDLCQIVLLLKSLGIDDLVHFDFIDPPPTQALIRSLENLYNLGALNDKGSLTQVGRSMALIPGSPYITRMILAAGTEFHCLENCLIIAAMLEVGHGIFYIPSKEKLPSAEAARREFMRPEGDQFTLLQVYRAWESLDYNQQWCQEHFVHFKMLSKARDIFDQFLALLPKVGIDAADVAVNSHDDVLSVKRAIARGFFMQSALLGKNGQYKTFASNQTVDIHPFSALFANQSREQGNFDRKFVRPPCVIYHELVQTTKEYMRNCIDIDKNILVETAPEFFRHLGAPKEVQLHQ